MELRALVPVSIRGEDEHGQLGNRIAAMRGRCPSTSRTRRAAADRARGRCRSSRSRSRRSARRCSPGSRTSRRPPLLAQASRLNFSTRLFNLIVTNVPGPQFPLYLLGREMEEIVPMAFLPEDHALAVAIMSYNGEVDFGLLADYDAMPDIDAFATHLEESLAELLAAARKAAKASAKRTGARRTARPARHGRRPRPRDPALARHGSRTAGARPRPRARPPRRIRSATPAPPGAPCSSARRLWTRSGYRAGTACRSTWT